MATSRPQRPDRPLALTGLSGRSQIQRYDNHGLQCSTAVRAFFHRRMPRILSSRLNSAVSLYFRRFAPNVFDKHNICARVQIILMDLYQNLRMLDIPGFRQFARLSARLPAKDFPFLRHNISISSFQSSRIPMSASSLFLVSYLSISPVQRSFCLNRPHSPALTQPGRYLRYSDDRRHRLRRHHQKTFRQCDPHRLFRFQYPAEIRLARKRQISITWRKAGTQIESFFCCLRF